MSAITAAASRIQPATSRRTTWSEDLIASLLSLWAVIGLFLDGWAHHTRPQLESFFTPWHAVLYSGAGAAAAWLAVMTLRRRSNDRSWREAVPEGYGLGVIGVLGFGAAGVSDMLWHTIFGVEVDLEALLSPTHLLLFLSGVLMLTSPMRAAWRRPQERPAPQRLRPLLPVLISLTMTTSVVAFFFHYLSPLQDTTAGARMTGDHDASLQLASIFVTNVILIGPLILLVRFFGTPPRGAATLLMTAVLALVVLDADFAFPAVLLVALVAGVAADLIFGALRPSPEAPRRSWLAFALAPLPLWAFWFLAVEIVEGVAWAPELWSGAIVMTGLTGFALALLAFADGRAAATSYTP